jgi:uncharacterized cupredoxin-like copper-binding protein
MHAIWKSTATPLAGVALASLLTLAPLPASATSETTTVTVAAGRPSEFRFELSKTSVTVGKVAFKVVNKGLIPHTFKICSSAKGGRGNACAGVGTSLLSPGQSVTLSYTFGARGTYEYLCTVPGHAAAGMKGDLNVT